MPASAQISCMDAWWKPERAKQMRAASRISARRSDCNWALAWRIFRFGVMRMNVHSHYEGYRPLRRLSTGIRFLFLNQRLWSPAPRLGSAGVSMQRNIAEFKASGGVGLIGGRDLPNYCFFDRLR